jgi:hypothetical protein
MSERHRIPPVPFQDFILRMLGQTLIVCGVVTVSIVGGMLGYEHFEKLPWRSAFLNSAMLLGGMGPVDAPKTDAGKLFAGFYALYAGLVFLVVAGVLLAPVIHRIAHRVHWEAHAE